MSALKLYLAPDPSWESVWKINIGGVWRYCDAEAHKEWLSKV